MIFVSTSRHFIRMLTSLQVPMDTNAHKYTGLSRLPEGASTEQEDPGILQSLSVL